MEERYTQKKQYFMNEEVTIVQTFMEGIPDVQNRWIPIKHFFLCLNRLDKDNDVVTTDKNKLIDFIDVDLDMGIARETFTVNTDNTGVGRHTQQMDCIRLDVLAIAVTQFKPTAKKGTGALLIWRTYMQWLNGLLNQVNACELLVRDKKIESQEKYIESMEKRTIKGNTIQHIISATSTPNNPVNRVLIENFCFTNKWYEKKNNDVIILKPQYVKRIRKNGIAFTDTGKEILLDQFKDTNKRNF